MVGLWNSRKAYVSGVCRQRSLKEAEAGEVGSRAMKAMLKVFVFILRAGF